jgi:hypothetical protein
MVRAPTVAPIIVLVREVDLEGGWSGSGVLDEFEGEKIATSFSPTSASGKRACEIEKLDRS